MPNQQNTNPASSLRGRHNDKDKDKDKDIRKKSDALQSNSNNDIHKVQKTTL